MAFNIIARIGSSERATEASRQWRSRHQRQWTAESLPEVEPMSEVGSDADGEIEFSILDPEMSAILASIDPAVYAMIASRITRGLK